MFDVFQSVDQMVYGVMPFVLISILLKIAIEDIAQTTRYRIRTSMLSATYGTNLAESNGPSGNLPSSKSSGYGTFKIFVITPEENDGVNHGFISASTT